MNVPYQVSEYLRSAGKATIVRVLQEDGTFEYTPELGTVLGLEECYVLSVRFIPTDIDEWYDVYTERTIRVKPQPIAYSPPDVDGNTYLIVEIGTQTWFAENLKTTKYNDGTSIVNITETEDWITTNIPAYCWLYNKPDSSTYDYEYYYGILYNYRVIGDTTKNICPDGWHVPIKSEWDTLFSCTYNDEFPSSSGKTLKSFCGWNDGGAGSDDYGFSALPSGFRHSHSGVFWGPANGGYYWAKGLYYFDDPIGINFKVDSYGYSIMSASYRSGLPVRCVKD